MVTVEIKYKWKNKFIKFSTWLISCHTLYLLLVCILFPEITYKIFRWNWDLNTTSLQSSNWGPIISVFKVYFLSFVSVGINVWTEKMEIKT